MFGVGLIGTVGANGGGQQGPQPPPLEYLVIIAGHQSNMVGGQVIANGATIVSPGDDPNAAIFQWSPNGGLAAGDPLKKNVLLQAVEQMLYPDGASFQNRVGPALTYAKGVLAQNPAQKIVIITAGVGGTSLPEWLPGQPLFDSMAASWAAFRATYPNCRLHSVILSPLENEMVLDVPAATTYTELLQVINAYRALPGAAGVPLYMGQAVPLYVDQKALSYEIILAGARAAVALPSVGLTGGLYGGQVSSDAVHYTNVSNRGARAQWLIDQIARTAAFTAAPPPQVTAIALMSETLYFTSVGAPLYTIETRAAGSGGAWTAVDWNTADDNSPGQVFALRLPGTGNREGRVTARSYGGSATPSPVVTFTQVNVAVPAVNIDLDFSAATVDGSQNIISIPSAGLDATPWAPVSNAGSGAVALITRVAQGGSFAANFTDGTKRFRRTSYTWPAGDFSFNVALYYGAMQGDGVLVGWAQNSNTGDIVFSASSVTDSLSGVLNNNNGTHVNAPGHPVFGMMRRWVMFTITYDRTANVMNEYMNGVLLVSGTPQQRNASPSNASGSDFLGLAADSNANGWPSSKQIACSHWTQVLTAAQIQTVMGQLQTKFGIVFG